MSLLQVVGNNPLVMSSRERQLVSFGFTADLGVGETISSAVSHLVNLRTEAVFTDGLDGSPAVSSPSVSQWIHNLEDQQHYRLTLTATTSTGRILDPELSLVCEY